MTVTKIVLNSAVLADILKNSSTVEKILTDVADDVYSNLGRAISDADSAANKKGLHSPDREEFKKHSEGSDRQSVEVGLGVHTYMDTITGTLNKAVELSGGKKGRK